MRLTLWPAAVVHTRQGSRQKKAGIGVRPRNKDQTMRYAVTLFYCEEQNEPSKPDSDLILLPPDEAERDRILIERYQNSFEHGEDENVTVRPTQEYGDLQVSSDTNDVHMFVTFVTHDHLFPLG